MQLYRYCGLVIALSVGVTWGQTGARRDLITNGGFEDGLAGWRPDQGHKLIEDPKQAHSGTHCLFGEVTEPKRAWQLKRTFRLDADRLYSFSIWARATNRTKLVLWRQSEGEPRKMVVAWERVPRQWKQYSIPLTVEKSGPTELHIIAPSSHNAPPGKIWIDDLALLEHDTPKPLEISQGQGFNDEPSMVAFGGKLYFAWVSFREGHDTLQLARVSLDGQVEQTWEVLGGSKTFVMQPRLVGAGQTLRLLYAAEVDGNWDIYVVPVSNSGPGKALRVTQDPGVDIKPAGALRGDAMYVAWESNRTGERQVFVARISQGRISKARQLSSPGFASYEPTIAAAASGPLTVAWHSFRGNNYDVFLCRGEGDNWGAEQRLTQAPTIDRHAVLYPAGDDLWIAWENANCATYHVGANRQRRLVVGKLTAHGVEVPAAYQQSELWRRGEAAALATDKQGRLWVAFLRPRDQHSGWDTFVQCWAGSKWSEPLRVSGKKGMDRTPQLALAADRLFVGVQLDNIPRSWAELDKTLTAKSGIYLAALKMTAAPPAAQPQFEAWAPPEDEFPAAKIRVERGEDRASRSIEYRSRKLELLYGDLHEHTDVSVCNRRGDQSIDESYQAMRDINRLDFACTTDHGYNINPYLWSYTAKLARANDDPGRFLTFLGEEWTSSFEKYSDEHPYGYYGHRNLILSDLYYPRWFNARDGMTPAQVWEALAKDKADFVHIPHQLADTGNVPTDWKFVDEVAQPVAEIFQTRGSYEFEGTLRQAKRTASKYFLQDAWANGIVIGVIASPDHGGGYGKACVFAPARERKAVLEAIRQRHTYGTTAAKIFLDVRVNGHLMGEKIPAPNGKPVRIEVEVDAPQDIKQIDVCRNNKFVFTKRGTGPTAKLTYTDAEPLAGPAYYYVRVIQTDDEIAWSSPVWLGKG